jgi:alkylation response protein AidB-like acyl-CoA dehydrogenase
MLVALSEDQQFFRDTTERFLVETASPDTVRALRGDPTGFDPASWRRGAELGWTSLLVDEAHGGGTISGAGLVDLSLVAYEFGLHAAPGPLLPTNIVAAALSAHDTGGDVLAGLLAGDAVACWCGVDPGSRVDTWRTGVTVRRDGDSYVLSGSVAPVEAAVQAAHLLVTAGDGEGLTQFLVAASAPGLTVSPMDTVDLAKRFGAVTFADVVVGADALVGEPGGAAAAVERQFLQAVSLLNAETVGAMQTSFDMTVEWGFDRYTFGRPLASYQAIKHRFADMLTWLEASHAISDAACAAVAAARPDAFELSSAAKAYVGQYGADLVQDCVQIHGGIGVTFEHDLHLYLRRLTIDRALFGTPAEHRRLVALHHTASLEAAA